MSIAPFTNKRAGNLDQSRALKAAAGEPLTGRIERRLRL